MRSSRPTIAGGWHEIAACEGLALPASYKQVRFIQINAVHFYDQDHPTLFWRNGILMVNWAVAQSVIREGLVFVSITHVDEEFVIKHEQLHFLLAWSAIPPGDDQHPMPYFDRCGMKVAYERS